MLTDPQMNRLLAEERAATLRRSMRASHGQAGPARAIAALALRIAERRRPGSYGDRAAAAGLPR